MNVKAKLPDNSFKSFLYKYSVTGYVKTRDRGTRHFIKHLEAVRSCNQKCIVHGLTIS